MSVRAASSDVDDRHTPHGRVMHWISELPLTALIDFVESIDHIAGGNGDYGRIRPASDARGIESSASELYENTKTT